MTITIYSTSTCSGCEALTRWLDQKKFAYTKKITDEDPAIMAEFFSVNDGMVSVPFTVITGDDGKVTKITGFNQSKLKQVLRVS